MRRSSGRWRTCCGGLRAVGVRAGDPAVTVLRRLDCVLAPVKDDMLAQYEQVKDRLENFGPVLDRFTEIEGLWNTSPRQVVIRP